MQPVTSGNGTAGVQNAIVSRLAAGDMDAAEELYDLYAGQVLALARRILRDDGDAEDVVQEVFSQAWRTARKFETARGTVAGWLLVMTRSRAIDRLRAKQARPDTRSAVMPDSMPAGDIPISDRLLTDEEAVHVREALQRLPDVQRDALELAYYEGLTQAEIATRLSEPLGTIKTRMRTALGTLRQRLRS